MSELPDTSSAPDPLQPRPADLVIHGAHVLCCDAAQTEFADGAVAISGGAILAVGPSADILAAYAGRETVSARGQMCLPGLINAHYHPAFYLVTSKFSQRRPARPGLLAKGGQIDRFLGLLGSFDRIGLTDAETQAGAMAGLLRLLKSGTTTVSDGGLGTIDGIEAAFVQSGMRGIATYGGGGDLEFPPDGGAPLAVKGADRALQQAADSIARIDRDGGGMRRGWFCVPTDLNASDAHWQDVKRLADALGTGISSHVSTVATQDGVSERLFGRRGIARLAELGVLGPNWMGIHMGFLDDAEVGLMADSGATVAHCPATSMGSGKGILGRGGIARLVEAGVTVVLGSDSPQWGDTLQQMQFAFYGHKEAAADDTVFPADMILDMATLGAARALLWDSEIGSIEAGKRADLILIDIDNLRYASLPHPVLGLLRAGHGGDVRSVWVDGRQLVRNGELVGQDEARILAHAREAGASLFGRL